MCMSENLKTYVGIYVHLALRKKENPSPIQLYLVAHAITQNHGPHNGITFYSIPIVSK